MKIARPKSWWYCPRYRWQFAFHRVSTPQKWHCICEKSVKKSAEIRRKHLEKKLTCLSARSASTGNILIAGPKSWWFCHDCRWQFVLHRSSTPLIRPWNCEKSAHESTQKREKKIGKTYHSEWPVNWQSRDRELTGHSQTYILKSFTFISFSSMHLSTQSSLFE